MTKEEAHYNETIESVVRPARKQFDVSSVKLVGPRNTIFWHFKYNVGDRIWDIDAPGCFKRAKEKMWKFAIGSEYLKESEVPKDYLIVDEYICEKPFVRVLHADGRKDIIPFDCWEDGEKKFNELTRRYRLIKRPY
jgi:hypothetical protein